MPSPPEITEKYDWNKLGSADAQQPGGCSHVFMGGEEYWGEWFRGERHGLGVLWAPLRVTRFGHNGENDEERAWHYEGEFKNGERWGFGVRYGRIDKTPVPGQVGRRLGGAEGKEDHPVALPSPEDEVTHTWWAGQWYGDRQLGYGVLKTAVKTGKGTFKELWERKGKWAGGVEVSNETHPLNSEEEQLAMDAATQAYRHSNLAKGMQSIINHQEKTKECRDCDETNCVNPDIVVQYLKEQDPESFPPPPPYGEYDPELMSAAREAARRVSERFEEERVEQAAINRARSCQDTQTCTQEDKKALSAVGNSNRPLNRVIGEDFDRAVGKKPGEASTAALVSTAVGEIPRSSPEAVRMAYDGTPTEEVIVGALGTSQSGTARPTKMSELASAAARRQSDSPPSPPRELPKLADTLEAALASLD